MAVATTPDSKTLNLRIKEHSRELIEQAAEVANTTVSDFVREAAIDAATNTLLDRTLFQLDAKRWDKFAALVDASPADNARLNDLMQRQPAWDK
ncbi:MAG: DUF1778 domain-containing protein [Gammaproteobacteria bacterium]|jgi:uncharacterized protein (DUF1778 family)|nr:DUF1778 domain-containing protein [Gammaproteobacteria bacterium]